MVLTVTKWLICTGGNADLHVKYALPISYWCQVQWKASEQDDLDSVSKFVWCVPRFPGFVPLVAPPLVSFSLVYLVCKVDSFNVRLCCEWEQPVEVEVTLKLTLNCCDRCVILHITVVRQTCNVLPFTASWLHLKRKKNAKTPWTEWYLMDICPSLWG